MVGVEDRRKKRIKVRKDKKVLKLDKSRSQKRRSEDKVENTRKRSKNDDPDNDVEILSDIDEGQSKKKGY